MAKKFRKGELAIMQNASYFTEYNGYLAVVESDLKRGQPVDLNLMEHVWKTGYSVSILLPDQRKGVFAAPHQLRRLKEPPENRSVLRRKRKPVTLPTKGE